MARDNRRKHHLQIRLTDRELEILKGIQKERGVPSLSDAGRFAIVYTHYGLGRKREREAIFSEMKKAG